MEHQPEDDDLPTVALTQEQYESLQRTTQRDHWETQEIAQCILKHSTVRESMSDSGD